MTDNLARFLNKDGLLLICYLYETDNLEAKYNKKLKKDLNTISFNPLLWAKLDNKIIKQIKEIELNFLKDYYKDLGGLNEEYNCNLL